jgi:hypothetical protein
MKGASLGLGPAAEAAAAAPPLADCAQGAVVTGGGSGLHGVGGADGVAHLCSPVSRAR